METNTYTLVHLAAGEGTYLTEADDSVELTRRNYVREVYTNSDAPDASPAYWREVPEAEAEEAMAKAEELRKEMEAEEERKHCEEIVAAAE